MITVCEMCNAVEEKQRAENLRKEAERVKKEIDIITRQERTRKWCETVLSNFFDNQLKDNPTLSSFNSDTLKDAILFINDTKFECYNMYERVIEDNVLRFRSFSKEYTCGTTDYGNRLYVRDCVDTEETYDFNVIKEYCASYGWKVSLYGTYKIVRRSSASPNLGQRAYGYFIFTPMPCELR